MRTCRNFHRIPAPSNALERISRLASSQTAASLMIAYGVPPVVVSRQLDHTQTSTTANIYAHAIASAQAKAAQTFDRFNDLVSKDGHQKPTGAEKSAVQTASKPHKKGKTD